jgi:LacI family transcriptional regulator
MPGSDQDFGYWRLIASGMEKAAKELEPLQLEVQFETFDRQSPDDLARAFAGVADLPGLALAPIHARVLRPLVEALDADRPLVFFDTDMVCAKDHCFVGQDPWQGGVLAARLLDLTLPAGAPLVLVRFDEDDEHLVARGRAFEDAARTTGRSVAVLAQAFSAPLDRRLAEARTFLAALPATAGIFVPNASAGEYARVAGGRRVVGYDLIPAHQAALRDGSLSFVLSQRPEVMGYEAVLRLGRALLFREAPPSRIALPLDIVVRENLAGHLEWSEVPAPPGL